jgi:hypothetical protein
MKTFGRTALMLALVLCFGALAVAGDEAKTVTLSGNVACAKCTLKLEGAKECNDVLVVTGDKGGQYWLVKNAVLEKFGHNCEGQKPVTITGTVTKKDGKMWLAPTKMEASAT